MASSPAEAKLPLPVFLKIMTNNDVPVKKAMAAAAKIYKDYSTPSKLNFLTDHSLKAAGIEEGPDRKLILSAFRKAGYQPHFHRKTSKRKISEDEVTESKPTQSSEAGSSSPHPAPPSANSPSKRKRTVKLKPQNEFIPAQPDAALSEVTNPSAVEFHEVMDEYILRSKRVVVNRAPVMAAWATVVAERLGFQRSEALSIASVYTEMNALSKGVSIGRYKKGQDEGMEASRSGSQPYVELMGRSPLFQTQSSEWRALSASQPVSPLTAHDYISRSFRQNTPYVIGALRLLAGSYSTEELKEKGWVLYTMFRPEIDEWGKRSELSCAKILSLRKKAPEGSREGLELEEKPVVGRCDGDPPQSSQRGAAEARQMSLEEYEATLDEDHTFDDVNLDFTQQVASSH